MHLRHVFLPSRDTLGSCQILDWRSKTSHPSISSSLLPVRPIQRRNLTLSIDVLFQIAFAGHAVASQGGRPRKVLLHPQVCGRDHCTFPYF